MRIVYLLIVLAFPVLDLLATLRIANWTGVPLWVWLGLPLIAGFLTLRNERLEFRARTIAALRGDHAALRDLFDSGRKVLAGFLLILPGVISDFLALALLAFPLNLGAAGCAPGLRTTRRPGPARGRTTIDGEYRRLQ
jgi:UPF0716 protein FxsA